MGYKSVCLDCHKSYSLGTDFENMRESACPQCGKRMVLLNHKFRPPKLESKQWEVVKILVENGFKYQRIFSKHDDGKLYAVDYPITLKEAKEFISLYKSQAFKETNYRQP